jgi:hypothetical protein
MRYWKKLFKEMQSRIKVPGLEEGKNGSYRLIEPEFLFGIVETWKCTML